MTNKCGILTLYGLINNEFPEIIQNQMERGTLMGRDCVSERIATTVPDSTLQYSKTEVNVLIHLPSIHSCNLYIPFFQSITFRRYRPFCMKLNLDSTINDTFINHRSPFFHIQCYLFNLNDKIYNLLQKSEFYVRLPPTDHRNLGDFIVRHHSI